MRYARPIALILIFLPLVALASGEVTPADDGFDPGPLLIALLFAAACLVLVGVGIVFALLGLTFSVLLVAMGVASTSALIALMRRRISSGLRAFHYQIFALVAAPCGVIVLALGSALFHYQIRYRYMLMLGIISGACAGIAVAFLFDRVARFIYKRITRGKELGVRSAPTAPN